MDLKVSVRGSARPDAVSMSGLMQLGEPSVRWCTCAIALVILLTSSCGGRSLSAADLEPLLIRPGDLPNGLTGGSVRIIEPDPEVVDHDQALEQEILTREGDLAGAVQVYLFRSKAERDRAYDLFTLVESQEGVVPISIPVVGEVASARHTDEGGIEVVFVRCHAVAAIWLTPAENYTPESDDLVHYAQQLDRRLESAVCP